MIDPQNTWITSDSHWGHANIVGFCARPTDHESLMLEEWAQVVPPEGTLLHLGDLSYRNNGMFKNVHAKHLTGRRKLLVRGNHDKQRHGFYRDCGFKPVSPFEIRYRDWRVSFSHYPWDDQREGHKIPKNTVRVHGHIHNNGYTRRGFVPFLRNHLNVSVEQTHYRPVNLKDMLDGALYGEYDRGTDKFGNELGS